MFIEGLEIEYDNIVKTNSHITGTLYEWYGIRFTNMQYTETTDQTLASILKI